MAQKSGPISQGTTAERQFDDVMWRDLFGDEPGVVGDTNGTAYAVTLATDSDNVSIGSSSIRSQARVAGFAHAIPVGQPETITVPVATGSARTDIIALRYDPAYTGLPGPVRLVRIAGTTSAIPAYDSEQPGVEELPLYAITRQPGQVLSQATVTRLYPRIAPCLWLEANAALPTSSPLGTRLRRGAQEYLRALDSNSNPVWVSDRNAASRINLSVINSAFANYPAPRQPVCYWREERTAFVQGTVQLNQALGGLASLPFIDVPFAPNATISAPTVLGCRFEMLASGRVNFVNGTFDTIPTQTLLPVQIVIPLG